VQNDVAVVDDFLIATVRNIIVADEIAISLS